MVKNRAYTLVEMLLALILIGFLLVFSAINIKNILPDTNVARFKKTYSNIEKVVSSLLKNEVIYGTSSGFSDTEPVNLEASNTTIGFFGREAKFREAIQYSLNVVKTSMSCGIPSNFTISNNVKCFKIDDGTVIGVVDTDFDTKGVVSITEERKYNSGTRTRIIKYTPIIVYTDYKNAHSYTDAQYIGVSSEGKIALLGLNGKNLVKLTNTSVGNFSPSINCSNSSYLNNTQCKALQYLKGKSVQKSSL